MALRSAQVLLSCTSSLQSHSDYLSALNAPLAGFTQLEMRLPPSDTAESEGSQVRFPVLFPCMPLTLPRVLHRCLCSFFPVDIGLRHKRTGSACISALAEFIPQSGSSSYIRPMRIHEAASFIFVLRPTGLAGTPDWIRGTVSGQVPPVCYHPNPA